jgi:hypothetical protein
LKITVIGKTYYGACDPLATGVAREENWPEPEQVKVGKGYRFVYEGDADLAEKVASHLECLAEGFAYSDIPEIKVEGRAFAKDAARIRAQMKEGHEHTLRLR